MRRIVFFLFFSCIALSGFSQGIKQTIRGTITDRDTKETLPGANVMIYKDSVMVSATTSDIDGNYRLDNVSLDRYTMVVSFLGYQQQVYPNLVLNSKKELIINVELEGMTNELAAVEISAERNKGETINKMATVSSRVFSVEETERYAGSRGDPARMASNFAGVQGADDSRNDVVIRGNSPLGVIYLMEGINIPNPNHFAIAGSQGGPVSILNNKVLSNSDFFTGAFPAEYGNSTAGVFDIKMRNGNNEKHEFTGQFGLLGTELTGEGPISKAKHSSYLINYRYSTLVFFDALHIPTGTGAVPQYQDAAFKLNFPTKIGNISFFGIGGMSKIAIMISTQHPDDRELYGQNDRDQYFNTMMGVVGANWTHKIGEKTYGKLSLAYSYESNKALHQLVFFDTDSLGATRTDKDGYYILDHLVDIMQYQFAQTKASMSWFVNHKFNNKHTLKAGLMADNYFFYMHDSLYTLNDSNWTVRWDYEGAAMLIQPYVHWKWKLSDRFTLNSGLHAQYLTLNNSFSGIEPRAGLRMSLGEKQWINAGFGMHSQMQPSYTYFYDNPNDSYAGNLQNKNMGFSKSIHYVLGYEQVMGKNMRLKLEAYYQSLYNIPVTVNPSSFSLINEGTTYGRIFPDSLENKGTGNNYGLELTLERYFANSFYFMCTASLYESNYIGSDGVERSTDFNGNYATNLLASKEFKIGKSSSLSVGAKVTYAGNKRYGPADVELSKSAAEVIVVDSLRNSLQFDPYFRLDLKINYKINRPKVAYDIGIDLVNVTNKKNVLKLSYAPNSQDPTDEVIREEYQLGLMPLFYVRFDF